MVTAGRRPRGPSPSRQAARAVARAPGAQTPAAPYASQALKAEYASASGASAQTHSPRHTSGRESQSSLEVRRVAVAQQALPRRHKERRRAAKTSRAAHGERCGAHRRCVSACSRRRGRRLCRGRCAVRLMWRTQSDATMWHTTTWRVRRAHAGLAGAACVARVHDAGLAGLRGLARSTDEARQRAALHEYEVLLRQWLA